jgi:hypothetical protein
VASHNPVRTDRWHQHPTEGTRARTRGQAGVAAWLGGGLWVLLILALGACGRGDPFEVTVVADGQTRYFQVQPVAVRDVLEAADITLGPLDRVEPDLYVQLTESAVITITRIEERTETYRESLPFERRIVKSEAVPVGERRMLQAGSNGQLEVSEKVILEDGVEVERSEVGREVVTPPIDEVILVGFEQDTVSVPISGTIAYLSGGNAWVMRGTTGARRNLTSEGDLDWWVFSLSPDGRQLLFTRSGGEGADSPLNSLWIVTTTVLGEAPQPLSIEGVIWAAWSPSGDRFAYSTAERSPGPPGWKAHNDLWLAQVGSEDVNVERVLAATSEPPYPWWGRSFSWSPTGLHIAYGQADQVGVIALGAERPVPLIRFPPYRTRSEWAWVPTVSWSPDGQFLVSTAHEADQPTQPAEDSLIFGLWACSLDGTLQLQLAEEVGMWSAPVWSPATSSGESAIAYGQAQIPQNSQDSRYELWVMDRDGSDRRLLFPPAGGAALIAPQVVWSPQGEAVLVVHEGNLLRIQIAEGRADFLTQDGQSTRVQWSP